MRYRISRYSACNFLRSFNSICSRLTLCLLLLPVHARTILSPVSFDMIPALRAEETAVLRFKESRNRLIDGDDTFRTLTPPSMIREDHLGKTIKPHEAHLSFNTRMFRAMANALPWDSPSSTEVQFVSDAFRQLSFSSYSFLQYRTTGWRSSYRTELHQNSTRTGSISPVWW